MFIVSLVYHFWPLLLKVTLMLPKSKQRRWRNTIHYISCLLFKAWCLIWTIYLFNNVNRESRMLFKPVFIFFPDSHLQRFEMRAKLLSLPLSFISAKGQHSRKAFVQSFAGVLFTLCSVLQSRTAFLWLQFFPLFFRDPNTVGDISSKCYPKNNTGLFFFFRQTFALFC